MARRVTRQFGDLPVFVRQALLRGIVDDLEEKDVDEVVITGIQPPRCGTERPYDPVNDPPPERTHRDVGQRIPRSHDPEPGPGHHMDAEVRSDHWAV